MLFTVPLFPEHAGADTYIAGVKIFTIGVTCSGKSFLLVLFMTCLNNNVIEWFMCQ